ncbi:MFS transporter [Ralstonia pseudosolanacearum]|uniref:MFS transporter n=1 Tax=Ralstonia pseudosolanacearum TaxID=1310165 RepID=UPI001FF7DA00|nr:MFS transporter [Ralstonia pseudosolanacearum]
MNALPARADVSVREVIDGSRLSAYQGLVLALCFAAAMLDGFDTAAIGYIAPALREAWHLTPPQLAPAFGAGLFGLMLGSLGLGPVADRFGRKPVLLMSVLVFGVATLACAASDSLNALVMLRFLTGLGLGGAMPICITLSAEYSPQRHRMLLVTLSWSGFTSGLALGGLIAAEILPVYGWRGVLVAGGVAPLVLLPVLALWMPESVQFLAQRPQRAEALRRIVARIAGHDHGNGVTFIGDRPAQEGAPFPGRNLFSDDMAQRTVLLWVAFFCSLFVFYLLTSWLPVVMRDQGLTLAEAARVGAMVPLGGTIGAIALALLMDRAGSPRALIAAYFCGAIAVAAIGFAIGNVAALTAVVFVVGFGIAGAQNGINLLAAQMYPTEARATGVSWALGVGRGGSITGSLVGGTLMTTVGSVQSLFGIIALPALVAGLALFVLLLRPAAGQTGAGRPGNGASLV